MVNILKTILLKISTISSFQYLFTNRAFAPIKKRFIAGDTIENAITVAAKLAEKGFFSTIDFLGEEVKDEKKVDTAKKCYIKTLEEIEKAKIPTNISIKLSHFGILISEELCYKSVLELVKEAKKLNNFIRIDMEGYNLFDKTLKLHKQLLNEYYAIGIVIQAYLHRALEVIEECIKNIYSVRLCKGAYKESSSIAYQSKKEVDSNYIKLAKILLKKSGEYFEKFNRNGNNFSGIGLATHDHKIIKVVEEYVKDNKINKEHFEFQMLYGVRNDIQKELITKGYKLRIYIPFGKEWFGYTLRRMAERPANLLFVLRNIVS